MHEETDEGQTFGECPTNDHDDNLDDRNDPTCRAACQENDHSEEDVLKVEREPKKEWVSSGMVWLWHWNGTSRRLFLPGVEGRELKVLPFTHFNARTANRRCEVVVYSIVRPWIDAMGWEQLKPSLAKYFMISSCACRMLVLSDSTPLCTFKRNGSELFDGGT
tara:strand:+ start:780 stop:1268 length:489 start_codon:yes stop_codon:yes gene_type:complete